MRLSELGEFQFIKKHLSQFSRNLPTDVVRGIGDDCSVTVKDLTTYTLVSTDTMVEGIHFKTETIAPEDLGYRCVATAVSDIAGMGGHAEYVWVNAVLPGTLEEDWLKKLLDGIHTMASEGGVQILGGDTTQTRSDIVLSVTVMGTVTKECVKYRSGACAGDVVYVTGCLGDSAAGLKLLQESSQEYPSLIQQHVRPRPHLKEGEWLGQQQAVTAMMDSSDGVSQDLQRMSEQSKVGFHIDIDKLPLSQDLQDVSAENGWDPIQLALSGGEDYVLLFTVRAKDFEALSTSFTDQLCSIGHVVKESEGITFWRGSQEYRLSQQGYDHFSY